MNDPRRREGSRTRARSQKNSNLLLVLPYQSSKHAPEQERSRTCGMSEHRGPLEEMENVPDANHLCGNNVDTHYERLANTSKSKRSELDPPGFPSAAQQISQSIYVCFVAQLWRATWYAWDYWLGFGWLGTLSSLAAGLFIITCFRSTTELSRLVPVNPDVTVPQRLSDSTPTVTHSSTEQLSVFRYHEHNLSIRRRIPRQAISDDRGC